MNIFKYRRLIKKARMAFELEDYKTAILNYEIIGDEDLDLPDLEQLALSYLFEEKIYQAKNLFTIIEAINPSITVYNCLFVIAKWEGKTKEAELILKKGLDLGEEDTNFYFSCALFFDSLEDNKKAKEFYAKVLSLDESHYWANLNLGSFYEQEDKNTEALKLFKKAKTINPNESCASYNLAVVYTKEKKYDLAKEHYLEELKLEKPYIKTYNNLALLYMNHFKDNKLALEYFLEGIKLYPEEYELWYNLACLYALEKDFKNTTECLLFLKYKNKSILESIENDPDLLEYRASKYYIKNFK